MAKISTQTSGHYTWTTYLMVAAELAQARMVSQVVHTMEDGLYQVTIEEYAA